MDLYQRLSVFPVHLPPLRDRGDDILLLAHHFASKYARELGRSPLRFSDEALHVLRDVYRWPGNVRELENLVHRMVVMIESDIIDVTDLPGPLRFSASRQADLTRPLAEVEAEYIRNVLASVEGNKTKAAEILQIDRKTLRKKLENAEDQPYV